MLKRVFESKMLDLRHQTRVWKLSSLILLASNLILCVFVFTMDMDTKTILVPMELGRKVWLKGSEVSSEYIRETAPRILQHLLSYNPKNVRYRFGEVLKFSSPAYYGALKSRLDIDAKRVQRNSISQSFHLHELTVKKAGASFEAIARGELVSLTGSRLTTQAAKTFKLNLQYTNSNLWIQSYEEVK